jgi:hypothetical protein
MGTRERDVQLRACQLLLDARSLVGNGWSGGAPARDGDGNAVDPLHHSAVRWSLVGALDAACARQLDGRGGERDEAKARSLAFAALAAAIDGDGSEDETMGALDRAIRELEAPRITVRCLRCRTHYTKRMSHDVLDAEAGCPRCGYQGWSFVEDALVGGADAT